MAQVLVTEEYLEDTADAIRAKLNTERSFTPAQMADGVREIHGDPNLGTKSITANGTYSAASDNVDGFSSVEVAVPGATLTTKTITENGTYNASTDGADGFSSVAVNVQSGIVSGVVLSGKTNPSANIGDDESLYVKYYEAPEGYDHTYGVDEIYRKVSGVWVAYTTPLMIVPFATGTDAQIAAMVAAMDAGILDPDDTGWAVGDERTISLAAMGDGGYVGETQEAQTMTFVIMDTAHYDLTDTTVGGDTKSHFVIGMKNSLKTTGYINSTNTNVGSWEESKRRAWLNDIFRTAMPETIRTCFKRFKVLTASSGTTNEYTNDYFSLFAEKEIIGSSQYSNPTEADALTQIEYYKTAANRVKKLGDGGNAYAYWTRSPRYNNTERFCNLGGAGGASFNVASYNIGISPFGCI